MSDWSFKREESQGFSLLPEGDYRVRIASAEKAVSKSDNPHDMLNLKLEVSGSNNYLFDHIVFLPDRPEITNRKLTAIFDSFKDIKEGDFNLDHWTGKVGAAHVRHEEYPAGSGKKQAKVHYFISADKQGDLPPWKEPERKEKVDSSTQPDDGFVDAMSAAPEIPFF